MPKSKHERLRLGWQNVEEQVLHLPQDIPSTLFAETAASHNLSLRPLAAAPPTHVHITACQMKCSVKQSRNVTLVTGTVRQRLCDA
jgi:hypothetical protein